MSGGGRAGAVEAELDLLLEAVGLKALPRAGWVRVGVAAPESVAAHAWGVAWLALALCPPDLHRERALAYAVLHDLAEVRVGDITPHDGVPADEKARAEDAAAADMLRARPDLLALWRAYEAQADPEARFVRQLDRLDMALQAVAYADEADVRAFFASARRVIADAALTALLDAAEARASAR